MPIRCKSCGFLNKDSSKSCERCSFDLRYSVIFDKAIESENKNPKMLFDIEQEPEIEENNFENMQNYEIEDFNNNSNNIEEDFQENEIVEDFTNVNNNYKTNDNIYKNTVNTVNLEGKKGLLSISVEILIFMILYLFFYLLTKFLFPNLHVQNSTLLIVTVFFYLFLNTYSFLFKGKALSFVFLEKNFKQS